MIGALCKTNFHSPFMFAGHCNTKTFEIYIEKVLLPNLTIGMTVIIDNASFHKSLKIKELIESAGCKLLFLPPYSPDLNPIEHYWHKLKTNTRKLMRDTKNDLEQAIIKVLKKESMS